MPHVRSRHRSDRISVTRRADRGRNDWPCRRLSPLRPRSAHHKIGIPLPAFGTAQQPTKSQRESAVTEILAAVIAEIYPNQVKGDQRQRNNRVGGNITGPKQRRRYTRSNDNAESRDPDPTHALDFRSAPGGPIWRFSGAWYVLSRSRSPRCGNAPAPVGRWAVALYGMRRAGPVIEYRNGFR